MALALLPGYAWLAIGGILWLAFGAVVAGPHRDAQLHAVFLGFVFSMIFGHAPVIFPGVLGIKIPFRPIFYLHLTVLHVGLALRVVGDLATLPTMARAGAMISAVAILMFIVATVGSGVAAKVTSTRRAAARARAASVTS